MSADIRKLILVVDDDEDIRESLKEVLEDKGFHVLVADNGVTGLKIFSEMPVDLIVLDLNMPRMDGYMFMERLNQIISQSPSDRKRPPIIILTAVDRAKDLGLSRNLGAVEYLEKPYKTDDLVQRIKVALSNQ